MKFYPADWRADAMLRLCSIAARGLWAEMMCLMHEAEHYGSLLVNGRRIDKKQLAGLAGISEKECSLLLLELEGNGVFSRDDDGTIYSRRMRRDHEKAIKDKTNGTDGGNPTIRRGTVPKEHRVRPYRRSDAPEKTLRIFAKNGGRCHWCDVTLLFDPDGSPNGFHVDHLLPICDGGTNDDSNLVPSCAACNHKRARMDDPTASPVNVGNQSDVKAQKLEAIAREEDGIGDARAGASSFTEGSKALSSALWKALGISHPLQVPIELAGSDWRAIEWERAGWTVDLIDAEARRIGPGKPLTYYEKCFATSFAKRQAPLPVVEIREAEKVVSYGKHNPNSVIAAIDRQLAALQEADGIDPEMSESSVLRISSGPVR